jgi:hypothetical protein
MDALFRPASDPALFLLFSAGVHAAGVSPPVALEGFTPCPRRPGLGAPPWLFSPLPSSALFLPVLRTGRGRRHRVPSLSSHRKLPRQPPGRAPACAGVSSGSGCESFARRWRRVGITRGGVESPLRHGRAARLSSQLQPGPSSAWCRLFVEQRGWAVVLICAFIAKASPVTARAPPWNRCAPTMTSSWPLTPPGKPCARR